MAGNVYVQFREEERAANALGNLAGRFYAGRTIIVDISPVTDFYEATCRQYEENTCNFMHLKKISSPQRVEAASVWEISPKTQEELSTAVMKIVHVEDEAL